MAKRLKYETLLNKLHILKSAIGSDIVKIREAMDIVGYKSYASFYNYVVAEWREEGLIDIPYTGYLQITEKGLRS